mmetsp:Transcript_47222/g.58036  ORF Transcript_47222/g.58036 Transcript_47222/m.58036 type:complete len:288 (+) Transcript_47222:42-905(+)
MTDSIHTKVETTKEKSLRMNKNVYEIRHDVDWSHTMNIKTKWKFNKKKRYLEPKKDAFCVNIISKETASMLIELAEQRGFEDAGYNKDYRSNTRIMTYDPMLTKALYPRIKQVCPSTYNINGEIWDIHGLNPLCRWSKYTQGQKFDKHCDYNYFKSESEQSLYTVNIYLNGNETYNGGKTRFYDRIDDYTYKLSSETSPFPGKALIFNHEPMKYTHDGEILTSKNNSNIIPVKYLWRTDVIYIKRKIKSISIIDDLLLKFSKIYNDTKIENINEQSLNRVSQWKWKD